jgi:hypothetical protein
MYIPKSCFFGLQNSIVPHWLREKNFSAALNFMISQMVRNECVKFGGHVHKQVKQRDLMVKITK